MVPIKIRVKQERLVTAAVRNPDGSMTVSVQDLLTLTRDDGQPVDPQALGLNLELDEPILMRDDEDGNPHVIDIGGKVKFTTATDVEIEFVLVDEDSQASEGGMAPAGTSSDEDAESDRVTGGEG